MKKIIVLSLVVAVFSTGCLTCKKAFKSQASLNLIESKLNEAIERPSVDLKPTCAYMQTKGTEDMQSAAQMSEQAAYRKFYYTETICMGRVKRTVCDPIYISGGPYRHRYNRGYYPMGGYCHTEFRCYATKVVEHKTDGFEEAMKLASDLRRVDSEMLNACSKSDNDKVMEATILLAKARVELGGSIKNSTSTLLSKVGCYKN